MPSKKRVRVTERLPPKGQWVIAITPSYRCMAYLDEDGKWRDVIRREEIPNVQEWCSEEDDAQP